ncbi:MAG: putative porin [Gemmatimonadota bacterium]
MKTMFVVTLMVPCLLSLPLPAPAATQEAEPNVKVSADLRLRGELDRDRRTSSDRERGRIRFRVSANSDLGHGLRVGARLVTAPGANDPNSTHQNLGTGFRNFRIAFDRVFLSWKPNTERPLEIQAGKFAHPFLQPAVFGELVWDADIQPEGVGAIFEPADELRLAGGAYILQHQGGGEDTHLGVIQAAARLKPTEKLGLVGALGFYSYGTPDAAGALSLARENQGNALVTTINGDTTAFASRFDILSAFATATFKGEIPVIVSAELVSNGSEADGFDGNGFAVGGKVGNAREQGTWQAVYRYQDVGREAVFSALAQDDFLDATNFRGHLVEFTYQYLDNANVRFWTLWSARQEPREDTFQKRFRLDFNFRWKLN